MNIPPMKQSPPFHRDGAATRRRRWTNPGLQRLSSAITPSKKYIGTFATMPAVIFGTIAVVGAEWML